MSLLSRKAILLVAAAFCLTPWSSPILAIGIGVGLSLLLGNPDNVLSRRAAEISMKLSVVLLGCDMSFDLVMKTMIISAFPAAMTVVATLLAGLLLGRLLGSAPDESGLLSSGTAICGGTAITAIGPSIAANEESITVALAVILPLNTAALYIFPLIGHAYQLPGEEFGRWAGLAIHDISSVVAAAESYSPEAMQVALSAKLIRVIWLPVVLWAFRWAVRRERAGYRESAAASGNNSLHIPWFIAVFLVACFARSHFPALAASGHIASECGKAVLDLVFFLMGIDVSRKTIKALTWKPLMQGALLWMMVSAGTFSAQR
jgi:uncharacterized integral membrane protein (TIGR00698 family)